jgi:hypothetical protein
LSIKPLSYLGKYLYNNGGNSVLVNFGESYSILAPQLAPFHPISIADKTETRNVTTIAYQDIPIKTSVTETTNGNYWYSAAGIAKASFSVKENTGYRLFFTTEKYSDEDSIPLSVNIGNANSIPSSTSPSLYPIQLYDFNLNDYVTEQVNIDADGDVLTYTLNNRGTEVIDVQTGDGQTSLDIYISSNIERANVSIESISPRTLRLIAVSGVELKIDTQINTTIIPNGGDIIGVEDYLISEEVPGYSITTDLIRPISTDNTVYCSANCLEAGLGGRDIEDGPVVAAQEIEFITPFEAGYKRSRVTLLTDPSIIQGDYIDDNGVIPTNTFEFIRSLYPETNFEQQNAGRQFTIQTKIISPERGSPTKLLNYDSNLTGLTSNFGSYTSISENINHFKYESQYLPELVDRPKLPWHSCNDGNKIQEIQDELVSGFYRQTDNFGSFCRFSGVIDNVTYIDVGIAGGIPDIMKDKGYDYLDLEKFNNGYPGDLFGYSVAIEEGKILVGSPFAGFNTNETIRPWDETSEFYLGNNGGPGAVYMFEKTDSSWSCTRKFRPETLMGQISGVNVYSDQFGRSVAIRGDMIAIGAPKHDYGNYVTNNYGEFVRKSFDSSLDITTRTVQDLGNSGIRDQLLLNNVDTAVNSGAIYAYENRIMNWENRSFAWNLVQKVVNNSNNSQDFGKVIHLGKSNRTDSDYVLSAGSDSIINQNYGTGIAYSQDIMLRANRPSSQNSDISLHAKVIGAKSYDPLTLSIVNNGENSVSYYTEGLIRATEDGYLFLEVSGQDPSIGGFIEHRPYIKAITGSYNYGVKTDNNFNLIVNGINPLPSSILNMSILGE